MIRRVAVSVAAMSLGVAFVTPTSAIAAEDSAIVDSIVSGVLDVLDVSVDPGLISELASELTPDIFDPALVSEVSRALDANQDAAAVVALTFDTDGNGEISGTERAALNLAARENWRALEAVLAAHNSDDDDDESDDDDSSSEGSADDEDSSSGASGSNSGSNSSNNSDDDEDEENDNPDDQDTSEDDEDEEDEEDD